MGSWEHACTLGEDTIQELSIPIYARNRRLDSRQQQRQLALALDSHCFPTPVAHWHRPTTERSGNVVVVAGTSYGYRNAVVQRLIEGGATVRVYGPPPPLWVADRVRAAHTGVFLDHESKSPVFGSALACLSSFALSEGRNAVNCRVFETPNSWADYSPGGAAE